MSCNFTFTVKQCYLGMGEDPEGVDFPGFHIIMYNQTWYHSIEVVITNSTLYHSELTHIAYTCVAHTLAVQLQYLQHGIQFLHFLLLVKLGPQPLSPLCRGDCLWNSLAAYTIDMQSGQMTLSLIELRRCMYGCM